MARNLKIRDLTLRDGQQSSFATRMSQAQVDRCLPYYKDANFYAMEVWGGAVPDSVMRYLNENPWTRLETIYKAVGNVSKLTALSRGRNLFGYSPYTDEIIDGFCRNSIESGLGIMRIFDALNDVDNVKSTVKYVKQYGGIADCAENGQRGCGYILSGHYTTIRDMLEALKSAAGVRRTVTYLPLRLARSAAKVCEKFTRRGKKPFFTPYSIAVLGSNADFSHSAASRTFGYTPRPLLATLRDTAQWLCRAKPITAAT